MNSIDVDKVRHDTRACENLIHFNNAGASLMPVPVADRLYDFLRQEEHDGGYETAESRNDELENFYHAAARLLGCHAEEIAYAENATRAWDMAFYGFDFAPGDRILTTLSEYGSNVIAYNHRARGQGVELVFVPNDEHGQIDVNALEDMIDPKVKLISISMIPTGGGLVNPVAEVGAVAGRAGVPYLLDACQAVGHVPLDVKAIGCDVLTGTGRKYLRGPRGTGLLYVRKDVIETLNPPFLDQHSADLISPTEYRMRPDARRFENWEQHFAGKAALGVAIDYALDIGLEPIRERVFALAARLRAGLANVAGITVTDEGREKCGIVTFMSDKASCAQIQAGLAARRINVSLSDGSGQLVSFQHRGIKQIVRASVHYFNTDEEIEQFLEALETILAGA